MAQDQDPEISEIKSKIQNNGLSDQQTNTYELRSGILCRVVQRGYRTRCLPIIPHSHRYTVVHNIHESIMHLGSEKT
ncbi:unnamed protein product, partial [Nesidiocoris tenuis]